MRLALDRENLEIQSAGEWTDQIIQCPNQDNRVWMEYGATRWPKCKPCAEFL